SYLFFFSSRRRHTRFSRDWSSDVCSSDLSLGTIATLSPLMGLFGTIVGMIEIFGSQNASGANPAQLAHGISVALYNTGFGLAIAMPALLFYRHFRALVDSFVVDMEQQAVRFVDSIHHLRRKAA